MKFLLQNSIKMPNIFLCCLLIVMCSTSTHTLSNINSNVSNVGPQQLHVNIPAQGNEMNDQSAYLKNEIIDNTVHFIEKRKANNLVRTSMKNKSPQPGQRSLVLVFDATESMLDNLKQLRQGAEKLINKLSGLEDNPIYNYIFVPFREENGTIETGPSLVTDDKDELLDTLDDVHLYGGDDCPENMLSGLIMALKYALPNSYVYAFTDASASDYLSEVKLVELIQRKQATISFLITGYCDNKTNENYRVYERISKVSNGQLYEIKSYNIEQILDDVTTKLDEHHVLLTTSYKFTLITDQWHFFVDETISKIRVMVTGHMPKVWINDPNNHFINGTETVNLENVKSLTIDNPSPGKWEIEYVSAASHSVRITADSSLSFTYGFSFQKVSSLSDTSFTPLNGFSNVLLIVSSGKINLTDVEFQSQDNSTELMVLELSERQIANTTKYFYETETFDPPKFPFKIMVNGYSEKGNQIRRIISTSLQVLDGPPPEVFFNATNLNVTEGEALNLQCKSHSLVPSTVWIQHEQTQLKELQSNQSRIDIQYEVESTELDDNGQYSCNATNLFGSSSQHIEIKVKSAPFDVSIPQAEYIGSELQPEIEIPCIISTKSKSPFTTKWYFILEGVEYLIDTDGEFYKLSGTNLTILNLSEAYSGSYTCNVTSDSEMKSASTHLTVQYAPRLQESEEEDMIVQYGDSLTIDCTARALPPAEIKWKLPSATELKMFESPLQIETFKFTDEGLYECIFDNGIEPAAIRKIKVRGLANGPPKISKSSIKQIKVSEGDDIDLNCHCEMCESQDVDKLILMWNSENNKQEKNVNNDLSKIKIHDLVNIIDYPLSIKNVTVENSGIYTCNISNEYGYDTYSIEVDVMQYRKVDTLQEKSSYHKCTSNQYGNSVQLRSENSGETFPSNIYDCSTSDANNSDITVVLLDAHSSKKINAITIYSNQSDAISKCTLNELRTPDLTHILSDKRQLKAVDLHSNMSNNDVFECILAPNATLPFSTNPLLVVFVTPNSLSDNDSTLIQVKSNSESILKCSTAVTPLKWSKQPYTCEPINKAAIDSNSFYFLIEDPPKIATDLNDSIRLIRGEHSSITCPVTGSLDGLQIYWMDDQSIISNNSVLNIDTENEQFKEKNFTCVSENAFGKDSQLIVAQIIDRPELSSDAIELPQVKHIKLGERVNLTCPFDHFNHFEWFKNGEPFNSETDIIGFQNITIFDSGNYTCRVENEAGNNEYTYQIAVHYSPVIQNTIINETVISLISATNFSIDCQASGFPVPQFVWTHNGHTISTNANLFIEKLDKSHDGDYVCTATNENGASKIAFSLNILYAPIPEIDAEQIKEVIQNHSVILNCSVDANPLPTYKWYKNKTKIHESNESFIELYDVTLADSGIYECVASNDIANSLIPFTLNVFAGASIKSISENKTFDDNDEVVLTCSAIGNELPILKWSYDDRILISSSKLNLSNELSDLFSSENDIWIEETFDGDQDGINGVIRYKQPHNIQIQLHLNQWPIGVHRFLCSASNTYGKDERSTFIEHILKPTFSNEDDTLIDASDGLPVKLNCGDVNGYPVPEITWQKNDIDIDFALEKSQKYHLENDNKTLCISSVNDNDGESSYTCVATNSFGTRKHILKINLLTPPRLAQNFSDHTNNGQNTFETTLITRKGEAVLLFCPIDGGNPKPEISWIERNNERNYVSHKREIIALNSTLKVDYLLDDTIFICYANNSMGSFNYTFKVLVERAPELFSPSLNENNFNVGDNFTLNCDIKGLPEPNIMWYKNGNPITADNKIVKGNESHKSLFVSADKKYLQISNTNSDDFGEYWCVGENYLGKIKQAFDITFRPYWSDWSKWSECSEICGKGWTERHRICHQAKSQRNQSGCIGNDREVAECMEEPCKWSKWSECSRTCGSGQKYRFKGKMIEIVPCMRNVCEGKNIERLQYTPLITYESHRDTNKVLQQLNRNKNQRDRSKSTKITNHSRSSRSLIFN